jgi:hypothetical protein
MRSIFQQGILPAKQTQWLGQSSTTQSSTTSSNNDWGDDLAKVITAAGSAYGAYTREEIAEEQRRIEEQKRATAEANARTAQIQQQTAAMQTGSGKIAGMDKSVFFMGAGLLGLGALGLLFYMLKD